jgi:hypothetical protein
MTNHFEDNMQKDTLYKRLGGYDMIAAFVDGLLGMLKEDQRFSRFGPYLSIDSHRRARQLNVDFDQPLDGRADVLHWTRYENLSRGSCDHRDRVGGQSVLPLKHPSKNQVPATLDSSTFFNKLLISR